MCVNVALYLLPTEYQLYIHLAKPVHFCEVGPSWQVPTTSKVCEGLRHALEVVVRPGLSSGLVR